MVQLVVANLRGGKGSGFVAGHSSFGRLSEIGRHEARNLSLGQTRSEAGDPTSSSSQRPVKKFFIFAATTNEEPGPLRLGGPAITRRWLVGWEICEKLWVVWVGAIVYALRSMYPMFQRIHDALDRAEQPLLHTEPPRECSNIGPEAGGGTLFRNCRPRCHGSLGRQNSDLDVQL